MDKRRFVIIDDDAGNIEELERVIATVSPHADCFAFLFADEAVRLLCATGFPVDYIFVHANMARMPGGECLRELKKCCADARVILYSGLMPAAVGETFRKMGAYDYFQKPVHGDAYEDVISQILHRSDGQQHFSQVGFR